MDPRKLGEAMTADLDTRYLEKRKVRGKVGWAWNNRHAAEHGIKSEWLGYDPIKAAQRADTLNKMYDRAREGVAVYANGALGWWFAQIEKTDEHNDRPDRQRQEVEAAFKRVRATPLINAQMTDISAKQIKRVLAKLVPVHGLDKSHRMGKWMRYAFGQAVEERKLAINPLTGVKIPKPRARQVVIWENEVEDLIGHFTETEKRPSLALGVRFGFDTSQRPGDIIGFPWTKWLNGDILVKQAKTGSSVRIPALPELRTAIEATARTSTQIIVSEETSKPYLASNFSHLMTDGFRKLKLIDEDTGQPKVFRDLRRSAVVRLALAGCTIPMISAITGHSYARCEQILETYLPRTTEMARMAIAKLLESRKA